MKYKKYVQISVPEHTKIYIEGTQLAVDKSYRVTLQQFAKLRRLDRSTSGSKKAAFRWSDSYFSSTSWVGVVRIPGLQIEIRPKLGAYTTRDGNEDDKNTIALANVNLLCMLIIGGLIPSRISSLAHTHLRRLSVEENIFHVFARDLSRELQAGLDESYRSIEENLYVKRGKIHMPTQMRVNAVHRERFYCRYDIFDENTILNRIIVWAVNHVNALTQFPATQQCLLHSMSLLQGVTNGLPTEEDFLRIRLNSRTKRFEYILRYCEMFFRNQAPATAGGASENATLLFDMNLVFERFIAALVKKTCRRIPALEVKTQGSGYRRYIASFTDGPSIGLLKPDIILRYRDGDDINPRILDTKWKRLEQTRSGKPDIMQEDLYQMFAYANVFDAKTCVLLYPQRQGFKECDLSFRKAGLQHESRLLIRSVDLNRNLLSQDERISLLNEISQIVSDA